MCGCIQKFGPCMRAFVWLQELSAVAISIPSVCEHSSVDIIIVTVSDEHTHTHKAFMLLYDIDFLHNNE